MQSTESVPDDSKDLDDLCSRLLASNSVPAILGAAKSGIEARDDAFKALSHAANLCRRSKMMRTKYEKFLLEQFVDKVRSDE